MAGPAGNAPSPSKPRGTGRGTWRSAASTRYEERAGNERAAVGVAALVTWLVGC
jgi:hypothetical protein